MPDNKPVLAILPVTRRLDPAMLGDNGFERVEGDRYFTETWVTQALLDAVRFRGWIWEPACGRGDMVKILEEYGYAISASDIAGDSLGCTTAHKIEFLTGRMEVDLNDEFSIVTNPPYIMAEEFIRRSLELTKHAGGMVAMLMRNEYDCAASRRDLFERDCFAAKLVLTRRPRWVDDRHSASPRHNFAWYLWDWQHSGAARIEWLPREAPLPLFAEQG